MSDRLRGYSARTPVVPETELDKAAEAARASFYGGAGSWGDLTYVGRDRWRDVARAVLAASAPRALARVIPARRTDPGTSHAAGAAVTVRAGSQRHRLLEAFALELAEDMGGLTDENAMHLAEGVTVTSEYAKRCSELREAGFLEPTGETRKGASGMDRIVSRITDAGRRALE